MEPEAIIDPAVIPPAVELQVIEPAQTEQPPGTTETVPQDQTDVQPELPKWKLKHGGEEIEVDENEVRNLAQQGLDYTKKMQSLSAVEKSRALESQLAQAVMGNPILAKAALLGQAGLPVEQLLTDPVLPNEAYRETYPDVYNQQVAQYNTHMQIKKAADTIFNALQAQSVQSNNQGVLERARLENNLDDGQFQQVQGFVFNRMRPNQSGMYSSEDVNYAVMALYGRDKIASEKLTQANKIQQTIKSASTQRGQVAQKPENLSPMSKEAREYKEYVERASKGWASKG